jgi:hypothetical protein
MPYFNKGDRVTHPVYGPGTFLHSDFRGCVTAAVRYDTRPQWLDMVQGNYPGNACGCDQSDLTLEAAA